MKNKFCCIVIVFGKIDTLFYENWNNSFDNVILVWNNIYEIDIDCKYNFVIVNNENVDFIAGGLNKGILKAIELGYDNFLLMDCDSMVLRPIKSNNFLEINENTIIQYRSSSHIYLGVRKYGARTIFTPVPAYSRRCSVCIHSGNSTGDRA